MSSLWEGFPLVLIEALSLKTPIVATDCPSGPSEALDGGRYGELVPMNDASALATALLEALGGKTKSAPEEWLRQFHPDYVADEYLKLMMARSS
jgi:glycosyltransferase involved in cell wall biosynthesis